MKKISLQKNNKDKKMTSPLRSDLVALSSYLVGTHNTVYEVHSCRRSPIFCSSATADPQNIAYPETLFKMSIRHIWLSFFLNFAKYFPNLHSE